MLIYEYECLECGIRFEKLQRFGDPDPDVCPKGHRGVHRLLSQPAIIFKGPGFYVTDHGRNGHRSSRKGRPKKESEASSSTKEEAQDAS